MEDEPNSTFDGGDKSRGKRLRRWLLAHAPWLWTPNGHDWMPTSWVSLGALAAVIIGVGIVVSLLN